MKREEYDRKQIQREVDDLVRLGKTLERRPKTGEEQPVIVDLAALLLRIRDRRGVLRPLRANPAQLAFEQQRGQRNIVLKGRQMGITTWIAARFFLKTITRRGEHTVLVAQDRKAAEGIFLIVQRFWNCLPAELREGPLRRSIANVGAMRFPELDSEFRVLSASDPNAGRGLTLRNLHCTEVSRWPGDARETLTGLLAGLAPSGELVLESTPRGAYGCFYEEWGQAVAFSWNEKGQEDGTRKDAAPGLTIRHFFPWWLERAYKASPVTDLTPDEEQLVARHGLTPEQIGYRRGLERTHRHLRSQEFAEDPETCFRATGNCCFEIGLIEARMAVLGKPLEVRRGGALQLWLPARPDKRYILGVDSAGGGDDGDFAAVQVIELETGLQCAELRQRLRMNELAAVAAALGKEYGNAHGPALLAVERNNHGAGVLAYLDNTEHYANVYRSGNLPGFITTAASKPAMVGRMGSLLHETPEVFFSRRLLAECRTFIARHDGTTGAANGAHDDCFMAMAVAQSVRMEILNKGGRETDRKVVS